MEDSKDVRSKWKPSLDGNQHSGKSIQSIRYGERDQEPPVRLPDRGFLKFQVNRRGNSGFLRSVHVSRKSGLGLLDDGLESLRIGDGQLGESATIQLDAGKVQALDEAVVGDAFGADGSVDALDPQLAEVALASALRSRKL